MKDAEAAIDCHAAVGLFFMEENNGTVLIRLRRLIFLN